MRRKLNLIVLGSLLCLLGCAKEVEPDSSAAVAKADGQVAGTDQKNQPPGENPRDKAEEDASSAADGNSTNPRDVPVEDVTKGNAPGPGEPSDDDLTAEPPGDKPTPKDPVTVQDDARRYQAVAYQKTEVPDLGTRKQGIDWPSFLGPNRDSKSPEKGILTMWPEDGPPIVWQRSLGTSYGIGSVSRGRFFQFDRHDDHARLNCLNAETGELLWKWEYPTDYEDYYGYNNGPRCTPVVDDDRVYIFGAGGKLHCLRATDGQLFWQVDTQKEFGVVQNFFGVGSTPIIEGDLLICMVGGSPESSQVLGAAALDRVEGNGTGIVALDKFTGEVRYSITDELASYSTPISATIGERRWCFVFARSGLVGFEPEMGKVLFHYPWRAEILESVNASTPVVVGDEVFISETYGPGSSLLKVKPGGCDVVWLDGKKRDKSMQTHWNTAVYHDGFLYGSSGRHTSNAELRCIDWKTGEVQWSEPRLTRSSLLYADGHLVCLSEDGVLRLLKANPKKYDVVATARLQEKDVDPLTGRRGQLLKPPCWAAPILSHGLLYVRGDDKLVCLELIPEEK